MGRFILSLIVLSPIAAALTVADVAIGEDPRADQLVRPLALADLEQLAWHHHPALIAAAERYQAARNLQAAAGGQASPILAYDTSAIGADGTPGAHGFYVEQEFVREEKRVWAQSLARYESDQRHWETAATATRILADIRRRYTQILTLQRHLELDRQAIVMAEELERLTRDMHDTEEATEADVLLAQGLLRRRHLDLRSRQSRLLAVWQELAAAVGCLHLRPAPLHGTLDDRWITVVEEHNFYAQMIAHSADLQVAQSDVLKARAAVALQRAEAVSNVTVRAGAQYDFVSEQPEGSLRFVIPLRSASRVHSRVGAAEAELRQAAAEVERRKLELHQRAAQLLDSHRRNAEIVEEYRSAILPGAHRAYQIYMRRFADEKASYSDAESAMENYLSRLREYLDALGRTAQDGSGNGHPAELRHRAVSSVLIFLGFTVLRSFCRFSG
jgi:outer membrane protein TolC